LQQPDRAAEAVRLSTAYDQALQFARELHAEQRRKRNGAPYLSHLLAVSGLVLEYGGNEAQAIAALLHDAIEDQAESHGGAAALRQAIADRFGAAVLHLIELCSDCEGRPKPAWIWRKQMHLAKLSRASAYECLVPACDKLHNLRCLNSELRAGGAPFRKLNAGPEQQLRHFEAMLALFAARSLPLVADLQHELRQLRRLLAEQHLIGEPGAGALLLSS
jgi:GTP pyrophosphokinase